MKKLPSTTPPEKRSMIAAKGAPEEVIVLDNEEEVGGVSYPVSKLCCLGTKYYNTGRTFYDFGPRVRPARGGRHGKALANVDRVSEMLVRDPIRFTDDDAYSAWNLGFTFSVDPRVKPVTSNEKWMVSLWGWLDDENPRFVTLQQAFKLYDPTLRSKVVVGLQLARVKHESIQRAAEIGLKHAIEWVLTFPDRVSFAKIAARFEEY
jgi:hypothetical protein